MAERVPESPRRRTAGEEDVCRTCERMREDRRAARSEARDVGESDGFERRETRWVRRESLLSAEEAEEEAEGGTMGREGASVETESGRAEEWADAKASSSFSAVKRANGVASWATRRTLTVESGCQYV